MGGILEMSKVLGMSHDPDGNKIEFMQYTDRSYQVVGKPEIEYK